MANTRPSNSKQPKWLLLFSGKTFKLPFFNCHRRHDPPPPSRTTSSLSSTSPRELHLHGVFSRFDVNGDGKISSEELVAFFSSAGEEVSREEVERAVAEMDSDGDGMMDYGDFVRLMEARGGDDGAEEVGLREAFEAFEAEKGSGCITPDGLMMAFGRMGEARSYEECKKMIRAYDVDGNGVIDYQEFHRMMTCS